MHKLIQQASKSTDLQQKAFWLPRSASEYERLAAGGEGGGVSSSSEDEGAGADTVWLPQTKEDYKKKETSV